MSSRDWIVNRDVIAKVFPDERSRSQFEIMQRKLGEVSDTTDANLDTTTLLKDAFFVTLSPNIELPNERVLQITSDLVMAVTDTAVILGLSVNAARATGGFQVTLVAAGDSTVAVPLSGILATVSNAETLSNKTLAAPLVTGLGDYVDDVAAAAGGVPVGGVYHNAGALRVRLT